MIWVTISNRRTFPTYEKHARRSERGPKLALDKSFKDPIGKRDFGASLKARGLERPKQLC